MHATKTKIAQYKYAPSPDKISPDTYQIAPIVIPIIATIDFALGNILPMNK